jgi:ABC-type antimicrobial peptide transport system permease subunit
VVSYSVGQRTQEIGIRVALGATRWSVLSLVLRQGMTPVLWGLGAGLAGSLALSRLITSQLFEVSSTDTATYVAVTAVLMLVTLAGCYVPARRATRIDPMTALRCE